MLAELAEALRTTRPQAAPPADSPDGSEDVECDVCIEAKLKAVKSCLVCLLSFCEAHVQPHLESPAYKKHKLVSASVNLQERICSQHDKLLEIFCRTDQTFLCYLCTMDQHKGHDTVSASAERTETQTQFLETREKIQEKIQQREKELQELRQAKVTLTSSAQTAVEDSERLFTELIKSIERRRSEVKELIRAQEKAELSAGEYLLEKLEQEMADLRRRDAELEQLSHTEDHIHFLQRFQVLSASTGTADLQSISVDPHFSFEGIQKALVEMKKRLQEACEKEVKKIARVTKIQTVLIPDPKTQEEFLQYACDLTLDANSVCRYLHLNEGEQKVTNCGNKALQPHTNHPERFHLCAQILCREGLSGRCYWEVEWRRGYEADLAVAYKGINRKEGNRFGENRNQSWCFTCTPYNCHSNRVGVFLDHVAGTLAFYSISDTVTLIHKIQTTFTEPLYPGFRVRSVGNWLQIINPN